MVTPTNHRSNDIAVRSLYGNIGILRHWLHIPKSSALPPLLLQDGHSLPHPRWPKG